MSALPPEFEYGKVTARVIHAVADSTEDPDALPDARPAAGSITFTPKETLRVVTTPGHKAFVTRSAQKEALNSDGVLVDAEGTEGVWLVVGIYDVSFEISGSVTKKLPSLTIEVTAAHTEQSPYDLTSGSNYVPPVGAVVQTLQVPSGGNEGQVLAKMGDSLVWVSVPIVIDAGDDADAARFEAARVNIFAATVEPLNADPDYDLWVGPEGA